VRRLPSAEDVAAILHEPLATGLTGLTQSSFVVNSATADRQTSLLLPQGSFHLGTSKGSATISYLTLLPALPPGILDQRRSTDLSTPLGLAGDLMPEVSPAVRRWLQSILPEALAGWPWGLVPDGSGSSVSQPASLAVAAPSPQVDLTGAGRAEVLSAVVEGQDLLGLSGAFLMQGVIADHLTQDAALLAFLH
jgi:hypothetical protein